MTDLLIDDDVEDDALDIEDDEAPHGADPEVAECPECDATFTGVTRKLALGRHRKAHHFAEWSAGRAGTPTTRPTKRGGRTKPPSDDSEPHVPRGGAGLRAVSDNVELFYRMTGMVTSMRDPVCGEAISNCAPDAARAWVELAKTNEKVRKFWSSGSGATGWLSLAMAHIPIALSIQGHHILPRMQYRREMREAAMMGGNVAESEYEGDDQAVVYHPNGTESVVPGFDSGIPNSAVPSIGDAESPFTTGGLGGA